MAQKPLQKWEPLQTEVRSKRFLKRCHWMCQKRKTSSCWRHWRSCRSSYWSNSDQATVQDRSRYHANQTWWCQSWLWWAFQILHDYQNAKSTLHSWNLYQGYFNQLHCNIWRSPTINAWRCRYCWKTRNWSKKRRYCSVNGSWCTDLERFRE
mgnify:CR=1 FL=1